MLTDLSFITKLSVKAFFKAMEVMHQNKISICIPVFNRWEFTKSCLNDLSHLNPETHEIIVVNNASTDGTAKGLNEFCDKMSNLTVVNNANNTGFSFASNQAYSIAKNDIVMFLNNDIKVYNHLGVWIEQTYLPALKESHNLIVSPTGGFVEPARNFQFCYETNGDKKFNYLSGWMLAATKETFNQLIEKHNAGPFRSDLYWCFFEDTHLSFKANELGIELKIIPNNSVKHYGHTTSKLLNTSKLYNQSRMIFIKEWEWK